MLLETGWALIEPDVLLPVEEVWPVSVGALVDGIPDGAFVADSGDSIAEEESVVRLSAKSSATSRTNNKGRFYV